MKKILRNILIVLLAVVVTISGLWHFNLKHIEANEEKTVIPKQVEAQKEIEPVTSVDNEPVFSDILSPVQKIDLEVLYRNNVWQYVENSSRVNFVVFAHDGTRADTIMFASYDPDNQILNVINIPRDTHWEVEGYTSDRGNKKINAVYGRGNDLGGSEGMKQAIADLLQVPVHYFVKINYDGAAAIIDTIGGVEVNVFKKMEYDDIYADPELHINIEEGLQVLDGKNSVDYLRWRQNNDLLDKEGDLPRITRMQNFMKAVAKQSINSRLPSTIQACFRYVYTDIEFDFASALAVKGIGIDDSDIKFKRLPGYIKGYFYEIDQVETLKYLLDMYQNSDALNQ